MNGQWPKIRVLHNAIDLRTYAQDIAKGRTQRRLLDIPLEVPVLAVVGQIIPEGSDGRD